jgi:hypothetical protein
MKVHVYSKLKKNKISKKIKSPNFMRNGRFDTSKCRGKLEKMGVLYTHSPKMSGISSKLPPKKKLKKKKPKNLKTVTRQWDRLMAGGRPAVARWPRAGSILLLLRPHFFFLSPPFFLLLPPLLGTSVNSTSLAPTHASPAQTSPKNFKYP